MIKISCIIPTYNEEPRIRNILSVVAAHPQVDEVIVVDDGSKDRTQDIVKQISATFPKVKLIVHEKNKGKSKAICTGVRASIGNYLMFIDADLVGVREEDLTALIEPVVRLEADVTISLRGNALRVWKWIGLDYISGERVMSRSFMLKLVGKIETLPKFGLEVYMNKFIIKDDLRIKIVKWDTVSSPYKYTKVGIWKGLKDDLKMMSDIYQTLYTHGVSGPAYQIFLMKVLEVKKQSKQKTFVDTLWNKLFVAKV